MPETIATTEPPRHQSGGLANTAGENVTTAIRADLKEFKAEINARVDGVASSIQALHKELGISLQSLQRENATIRWMIGIGFTLLSLFFAISTFLRSGGS